MCGISGLISKKPISEIELNKVRKMNEVIFHRGPDSDGHYADPNVAFAMRRLKIIDLEGGDQPLFNSNKSKVLVFNGEIYNYLELREELSKKGYNFLTKSDGETILHLFDEYGVEAFKKLRGMFAFALLDKKSNQVFLVRDRFGEKPIYVFESNGKLVFNSELKALIDFVGRSNLSLSQKSVYEFLTFQYIIEPETMFNEVKKVPAGCYLKVALDSLEKSTFRYWDFRSPEDVSFVRPGMIREALEESVKIMLRSDVPVGIALSGGIDSSLIAVLVRKFQKEPMNAYSIGYPGNLPNDERRMAKDLASKLNINYYEAELSTDDFIREFPNIIWNMDEPVGDIAAYSYQKLAELSKKHETPVLLSGLGADEFFWGYQWVRKAVNLRRKSSYIPHKALKLYNRMNNIGYYDQLGWVPQSSNLVRDFMNLDGSSRPDFRIQNYETDIYEQGNPLNNTINHLCRTWLVGNCLTLSDRLFMAHSIETRLPFLEKELVETVSRYHSQKTNKFPGKHKWLLIDETKDLLPKEIFKRPKRGFTPPVGEWISGIEKVYGKVLGDSWLFETRYFDRNKFSSLYDKLPRLFVYRCILLEVWIRQYLYGEDVVNKKPELSKEQPRELQF